MKSSRIAIVAHEMEGDRTGVGRYLEGLLQGLAEVERPELEFLLFFQGDPHSHPLLANDRFRPIFDSRPRAHPVVWEQRRLPVLLRRHRLDFLFSPAYSLPFFAPPAVPSMLTVHDLSFEHKGEEFGFKERWRRRFLARRGVVRASRVLADTAEIADEIAATYEIQRRKIGVVPLAVDSKFHASSDPQADLELLASIGIAPPFLLHVGAILPRRHVGLVIAGFAAVAARREDLRLVLAGPDRLRHAGELEGLITAATMAERIVLPGYVGDEILMALYRQAELLFYLSDYEGFGLPPLEAMAAGTLPVVGHAPGLTELWPEYPYRCPRLDRASVTAVVERLLADDAERRRAAAEGRRRVAELTWRRCAELFLTELERAITNRSTS